MTKDGLKTPNYFGSLTQAATCRLGSYNGEEAFTPFRSLLPMVNPNDIVLGGWDISGLNLAEAMERAKVLDWALQEQVCVMDVVRGCAPMVVRIKRWLVGGKPPLNRKRTPLTYAPDPPCPPLLQLVPYMKDLVPLPGVYDPDFIAANQEERADNIVKGTKKEQVTRTGCRCVAAAAFAAGAAATLKPAPPAGLCGAAGPAARWPCVPLQEASSQGRNSRLLSPLHPLKASRPGAPSALTAPAS